ncbi:uncharacterized protein LDX57_000085 [Aspergillus melleus]|uniref:uncharacterized protein n=1 Tax=Aspergillus melleus TaxID=138277 RepID=UPI001E8EB044|nr:uncharacterized protein LDX57_000085 [Aspergillus melleus]KAH8422328.1 hypothetical protein LDX57_000085 [Aspergillus melleus]
MAILSGFAVLAEHGVANPTLVYSILGIIGAITGLILATLVWPTAFSPVSRVVSWFLNVCIYSLFGIGDTDCWKGVLAIQISHQTRRNRSSHPWTGVRLARRAGRRGQIHLRQRQQRAMAVAIWQRLPIMGWDDS